MHTHTHTHTQTHTHTRTQETGSSCVWCEYEGRCLNVRPRHTEMQPDMGTDRQTHSTDMSN